MATRKEVIFWNYVRCVAPFSFDLAIYGSVLVCGLMSSQGHQDPNCEEIVEKAKI